MDFSPNSDSSPLYYMNNFLTIEQIVFFGESSLKLKICSSVCMPARGPKIVPVRKSGRTITSCPAGFTESLTQPTVYLVFLLLFAPSAHLHNRRTFTAKLFLGKYAILGARASCCFTVTELICRRRFISLLKTKEKPICQRVGYQRKETCPSGKTEVSC